MVEAAETEAETEALLSIGRDAGLTAVGVAPASILEPARTVLHLRKQAGKAGDMQFTYRNPDRSTDPQRLLPGARSLVAGAWGYAHLTRPHRADMPGAGTASVARYSWHDHYHDLEKALTVIADRLIELGYRAIVVADSNHLVDRNVAWSAGLGWYGKNSNLLLPGHGSWFVLGAVVTDAELTPTGPPMADGCGPCSRCIDDCPTDAIVAPGVVDATKCLAWLVQAGGPIPAEYRAAVGDRIYGCDDCQDVCPPNISSARSSSDRPIETAEATKAAVDLEWVLTAADDAILARYGRWYIAGRDVDVIRRTALVVLGNIGDPDHPATEALLRRHLVGASALLRAHAVWAAKRLGRDDLTTLVEGDPDALVAEELARTVPIRPELVI